MRIFSTLLFSLTSLLFYSQEVSLITQEKILGVINHIEFDQQGKYIASTNERDHSLMIWDTRSGKIIGQLRGHQEKIVNFEFNPIKSELISIDEKNVCYIWDLNNWSKKDSITNQAAYSQFSYSDDGLQLLAINNNKLYEFKGNTPAEVFETKGTITNFSKFGKEIYLAIADEIILINASDFSEKKKFTPEKKSDIANLFAHNTGVTVLTEDGKAFYISSEGNTQASFEVVKNPAGVDFDNVTKSLALIDNHGHILIYDHQGKQIADLYNEDASEKVKEISFNHNGTGIASTGYKKLLLNKIYSNNNVIQIWDINRQQISKTLKGDVNPIDAFAFSSTENLLYTLRGQKLDIWSLNSATRLGTFEFPERKLEVKDRGKDNVIEAKEETKEKVKEEAVVNKGKLNKWKAIATGDVGAIKDAAANKIEEKKEAAKTYAKEESKLAGKAAFARFGFQEDKIIISPKGNYLLTAFKNDEIRLYSLENGLPTYIDYVKTGQKEFYDIIFDNEEEFIAVGGSGQTPVSIIPISEIQNTESNTLEVAEDADLKMKGMFQVANALTLSNDGRHLVAVFNTGRIVAWSTSYWYKIMDINPKITMTRKPFIGFSQDGTQLFVNTGVGIYNYDFTAVTSGSLEKGELAEVTGVKKAKVEGFPVMTHRPLDHVITIADNNINFLDVMAEDVQKTYEIPCNLVTDVQVNKFGYVGVSLKNGCLTIFDPETGKERFTMVGEDENAIFKTPEQYYKITKEGQELVSFRVGKNAYPFEQFDAKYNRPDIVLEAMNSEDETLITLYKKAYQKRLSKLGLTESQLGDISILPEIAIENYEELPYSTENRKVQLKISGTGEQNLARLMVWNNDVPVYGIKGKQISGKSVSESVTVNLASGHNKIQVALVTSDGIESLKETVEINCSAEVKPKLYLISIGTSEYKDSRYSLNYAAKDANDLATIFSKENDAYSEVLVKTLTNKESTKENINALKSFFENATIDDVVMVFVAGHGLLDANYDYYYGTHDIDFNQPKSRGLAYELLESLLDNIAPLKRILIMDTCHSGEVEEEEIMVSNEVEEDVDIMFRAVGPALTTVEASPSKMMKELFTDLRRGTGATVLSSAGGAEFAMESDKWKNGLFTYSLLFGLRNNSADLNEDGKIMLSELQLYVSEMVSNLSDGKQVPTTRVQNIELDYRIW